MVNAANSTVDEVSSLLVDARLIAPEDGQIATIFPKRGELVAPGTPIMNLVVMDDIHVVLNVREDLMPDFRMGGTFIGDVPALAQKGIGFKIYYISPLGSFATWNSDVYKRQLLNTIYYDEDSMDNSSTKKSY